MLPMNQFRYRADLDGLRAIAVLFVVLFHAGYGCKGGYIGVDIFFVLSGYLITSLIWKDLENGHFRMAAFWERRVRRIVPALAVVTAATLVAGWIVLLPADYKSLGRAVASQAIFTANVHYWLDSGYFSRIADEKPLLHTWSLAVEEQFYLIVPLLLWFLYRTPLLHRRRLILSVLAIGFVCSLAISIYGVSHHPSAAFYLLPTRAWELLLGSICAFLPLMPRTSRLNRIRQVFSMVGMMLIVLAATALDKESPFPGLNALAPCLGAAFLILSNVSRDGSSPTVVADFLSMRPVVSLGMISYSLYLWHWPFLAFARYLSPTPLSATWVVIALALGIVCAILSWRFVETPFRTREICRSKESMYSFVSYAAITLFGVGIICTGANGLPDRFDARVRGFASDRSKERFAFTTLDAVQAGKMINLGVEESSDGPSVFVWGDSHALSALAAFDSLLKECGRAGCAAARPESAPLLEWHKDSRHNLGKLSDIYNEAIVEYITDKRISDVFLVCYWAHYQESNGQYSASFKQSLLNTVKRLHSAGSRVWILLDVPTQSFDVPKALTSIAVSAEEVKTLCAKPNALNKSDGMESDVIGELQAAGARILDPKPAFLDESMQYYVIESNGMALYLDDNHLTAAGAELMLKPLLKSALKLCEENASGASTPTESLRSR